MWHDHTFSQRNKVTEGAGLGGRGMGVGKNLKKGEGKQCRGSLLKIGG